MCAAVCLYLTRSLQSAATRRPSKSHSGKDQFSMRMSQYFLPTLKETPQKRRSSLTA